MLARDWIKNNKDTYRKEGKVYVDQEGGFITCGEYDPIYTKAPNSCGVLQGHCVDDADCRSGLKCLPITNKDIFVPLFHEPNQNYCQVEQCDKYGWEAIRTVQGNIADYYIKCMTCKKGFTGDYCTAVAA